MLKKIKIFLEMIKFEHTIFALPFAYLGAFLAFKGIPPAEKFFWITLAMVGARTAAMSLNRLIDRHIDALNPRTKTRAIPAGQLGVLEVWLYTIISFALLFLAAFNLNPLCVKVLPMVVFVLVIYSYMKRFSWACHLVLGIALGLAPVGSWIAITNSIELPAILLGLGVAFWVAGFDIIFACQDQEFDAKAGLHSIPVAFGIPGALLFARILHVLAPILLFSAGYYLNLGLFYYLGVLLTIGLLIYEHRLVSAEDLSKLNVAFFNINGYISMLMFCAALLDILIRVSIF